MSRGFLGIGWTFPVGVDHGGLVAMSEYEKDIWEAVWIILSTGKGERVMRPDFGCGIHEFIFAVMDTATLTLIENSVREALTVWEPRIELLAVEVSTTELDNGKLMISVDYRVRTTDNRFNLVYPFYLNAGR